MNDQYKNSYKATAKELVPCLSIMSDTSYAMPAISGDPESATTT